MIVGLPFETPNSLQNSIDWHKKYWHDQHCIWNALYIPSSDSLVKGINDQMSIIGSNLKKFNYRSLGTFDHFGSKWIDWINKDFSFQQALNICTPLNKNLETTNIGNLTLDDYIFPKRTIDNALLDFTTQDQLQQAQDFKYHIVKQYKYKKLSI